MIYQLLKQTSIDVTLLVLKLLTFNFSISYFFIQIELSLSIGNKPPVNIFFHKHFHLRLLLFHILFLYLNHVHKNHVLVSHILYLISIGIAFPLYNISSPTWTIFYRNSYIKKELFLVLINTNLFSIFSFSFKLYISVNFSI